MADGGSWAAMARSNFESTSNQAIGKQRKRALPGLDMASTQTPVGTGRLRMDFDRRPRTGDAGMDADHRLASDLYMPGHLVGIALIFIGSTG
jgi:hypothetical protein